MNWAIAIFAGIAILCLLGFLALWILDVSGVTKIDSHADEHREGGI